MYFLKVPNSFLITVAVVVIVQLLSHVQLFATPWTVAHQASLSSTVSWSLLKFMSMITILEMKNLRLIEVR